MITQDVLYAAKVLVQGGIGAIPTETVYGLAANALDDNAVTKIFTAKGRPVFNPLIVHAENSEAIKKYVYWNDWAEKLATAFWAGPLTMVLPVKGKVSPLVTAGLPTLAVRIPNHPLTLSLLRACDFPLAAPSANTSNQLSPTNPQHVADDLGDKIDFILDGGNANIGVESTIIDLSGDNPTLLRYGGITKEKIEALIGNVSHKENRKINAPGQLKHHYAPKKPMRLNAKEVGRDEGLLAFGMPILGAKVTLNLSETSDIVEAAQNLFNYLHVLQESDVSTIAVMPIPMEGLGNAINDRLTRGCR